MAAVDWFTAEVAPAPVRRVPRAKKPRAVARPRREGRHLTGGIVWISVFGVLLVGIVALNVAVLRANMALNDLNKQQIQLQAQNATLSSQLSSAGSSLRIEQAAHRLGLVPALAADTSYLDLGR